MISLPALVLFVANVVLLESAVFSSTRGDRGILLRFETSSILERWRFSLALWTLTFRFVQDPNFPRVL